MTAPKFTLHALRDLCTGNRPKLHVTIFDPGLPIHCTTFTMTLKGSLCFF